MSTPSGPAAWRKPLRAHAKGLLGPEAAVELFGRPGTSMRKLGVGGLPRMRRAASPLRNCSTRRSC
jgi:hypothetical protein